MHFPLLWFLLLFSYSLSSLLFHFLLFIFVFFCPLLSPPLSSLLPTIRFPLGDIHSTYLDLMYIITFVAVPGKVCRFIWRDQWFDQGPWHQLVLRLYIWSFSGICSHLGPWYQREEFCLKHARVKFLSRRHKIMWWRFLVFSRWTSFTGCGLLGVLIG